MTVHPNDGVYMADETLGAPEAPTEPTQSVDDFIGSILDAPDDNAQPETQTASEAKSDVEGDDIAEPETDIGEDGDTEEESEPEAKPSTIVAPQSMSAKDREAFAKLSPDQQKWLTDREQQMTADYTRKTMDIAKQKQQFESLDRVLAPHRPKFAHMGATEAQVVGQLLTLAEHADRDFVGFVQEQARLRGLPLAAFTQPGQQTDPQLLATQRRLQGVEKILTEQQRISQERELAAAMPVVEAFAKEHPFYADLEADMIPLVAQLRETHPHLQPHDRLARAYKMALAANDEVSAKAQAEEKAKAEAERVAKAKKAAAEAKKAGGTQPKSSGALPPSVAKTRNIDEFIGGLVDERMRA